MSDEKWDIRNGKFVKTPQNIIDFYNEIDEVCKKYNLSISHEDGHGAFILEEYSKKNIEWLKDSSLYF